ncbi:hypothetical protein GCM10025864_39310 [Luteimicrobium album]|uniref:Uncharacterized protein n=1 Tax=Luteimicrobium album TaxID=1054550 RepID=A0ABQ6I6A3_9MICO|nr:hypothetical protein [Luteimicrobium album]GMA26172.1 hypothetical protein GCM10025864_39310 [Luteimicrobium album]
MKRNRIDNAALLQAITNAREELNRQIDDCNREIAALRPKKKVKDRKVVVVYGEATDFRGGSLPMNSHRGEASVDGGDLVITHRGEVAAYYPAGEWKSYAVAEVTE